MLPSHFVSLDSGAFLGIYICSAILAMGIPWILTILAIALIGAYGNSRNYRHAWLLSRPGQPLLLFGQEVLFPQQLLQPALQLVECVLVLLLPPKRMQKQSVII